MTSRPQLAAGRSPSTDAPQFDATDFIPYLLVVASLLAVLALHLPWLPLSGQAVGHSFSNLIGQEVRWTMFSADPRGMSIDLWADIEYADGSTERWSVDRTIPEIRYYRWVKWMESAVLLEPVDQLAGLAAWLASNSGAAVRRVEIFGSERPPGEVGGIRPAPEVRTLLVWEPRK